MSPTQRSLKLLREEGWVVTIVEWWQHIPGYPGGGKRRDLFGFGDLLAIHPDYSGATIIQTTSGANLSARRAKIAAIPEAKAWLQSFNRIEIHGWRKLHPRGQREHWEVIREVYKPEVRNGQECN